MGNDGKKCSLWKRVTVEIIHQKAYRLLEDLAELNVIWLHTTTTDTSSAKPQFSFAKDIIRRIGDDFNAPLPEALFIEINEKNKL